MLPIDFHRRLALPAFSGLALAVALALLVVMAVTRSFAQSGGTYRVVGIASNDVLNIRSGAAASYPIVGIIPPSGTGVKVVGPCSSNWCTVEYESVRGWASMNYLVPEGASPAARTCHVVGVAYNDVLNMRDGPSSERYRIIGFIPPNGRGVVPVETGGAWWRVEYGGTVGWVSGQYLECP